MRWSVGRLRMSPLIRLRRRHGYGQSRSRHADPQGDGSGMSLCSSSSRSRSRAAMNRECRPSYSSSTALALAVSWPKRRRVSMSSRCVRRNRSDRATRSSASSRSLGTSRAMRETVPRAGRLRMSDFPRMPVSESSVFSGGLERGQRACYRVRYAERFENPVSVGHVKLSVVCLRPVSYRGRPRMTRSAQSHAILGRSREKPCNDLRLQTETPDRGMAGACHSAQR